MATDTPLVEHRLHFAAKIEAARRSMPRSQGLRRLPGSERLTIGRSGVLRFVAADTGNDFTRHRREPTPHQLHGLAIGVERLDGNRRVGRDPKTGGAVFAVIQFAGSLILAGFILARRDESVGFARALFERLTELEAGSY